MPGRRWFLRCLCTGGAARPAAPHVDTPSDENPAMPRAAEVEAAPGAPPHKVDAVQPLEVKLAEQEAVSTWCDPLSPNSLAEYERTFDPDAVRQGSASFISGTRISNRILSPMAGRDTEGGREGATSRADPTVVPIHPYAYGLPSSMESGGSGIAGSSGVSDGDGSLRPPSRQGSRRVVRRTRLRRRGYPSSSSPVSVPLPPTLDLDSPETYSSSTYGAARRRSSDSSGPSGSASGVASGRASSASPGPARTRGSTTPVTDTAVSPPMLPCAPSASPTGHGPPSRARSPFQRRLSGGSAGSGGGGSGVASGSVGSSRASVVSGVGSGRAPADDGSGDEIDNIVKEAMSATMAAAALKRGPSPTTSQSQTASSSTPSLLRDDFTLRQRHSVRYADSVTASTNSRDSRKRVTFAKYVECLYTNNELRLKRMKGAAPVEPPPTPRRRHPPSHYRSVSSSRRRRQATAPSPSPRRRYVYISPSPVNRQGEGGEGPAGSLAFDIVSVHSEDSSPWGSHAPPPHPPPPSRRDPTPYRRRRDYSGGSDSADDYAPRRGVVRTSTPRPLPPMPPPPLPHHARSSDSGSVSSRGRRH